MTPTECAAAARAGTLAAATLLEPVSNVEHACDCMWAVGLQQSIANSRPRKVKR
jgi:hypothetical protein